MNELQVKDYIRKLFLYYYEKEGVPQHIDTVYGFVATGKLNLESTPLYIESLAEKFPTTYQLKHTSPEHIKQKGQQQPTQQSQLPTTNKQNTNSGGSSNKSDGNNFKYYNYETKQFDKEILKQGLNTDTARDYVNELYTVMTGRLGDPASSNYLVTSLLNGSFTPQQAEFHVKFSKEAKQYSQTVKVKEDKRAKAEEYIFELFRVYCGEDYICTAEEVLHYVKQIVDVPTPNYQNIEDEIKLKAIDNVKVPAKKPFHKFF
ncbi:hypothetical protein PPL_00553 [Heterostelium album PN500]|uniref:Uncharacterized protein n=1 Tax=Heterostelium pallidum (strain ATCC 26659 / Pp 5 / PN500) TaxID=670386 RepID=D3AWS5_HETP5|nr:hypothetical protein PPL_00553 [Heterostelium album PN500]EFA86748.1 hypothetical protein PPL_00553 [Heterostelium album PN500]|eukprot:XP_020438852.1 hypothetical protein PPL_00553 [Heterostelium album PN500]